MKRVAACAALLVLAGCATEPEMVWVKPGATEDQFYADKGECDAKAFSVPLASPMQMVLVGTACMKGKGWRLVEKTG